jgi:hypothetical protein
LPRPRVAAVRRAIRCLLNAGFADEVPAPINDPGYAWRARDGGGGLTLRPSGQSRIGIG